MLEIALGVSSSQNEDKTRARRLHVHPLLQINRLPPAMAHWPRVDVYRQVNGLFSHTAKLENRLLLVRPI